MKALKEIREAYRTGKKRVLLWLPTGSGKTLIFCTILKGCHERNTRALLLVRGRSLVSQASRRITDLEVPHRVLMPGFPESDSDAITIASVDTLIAREHYPDVSFVVIDEAHLANSVGFRRIIEHYGNRRILSVTATPHVKGGLKHLDEYVVRPITPRLLIEQGYLVGPRYYAPTRIDLSEVRVSSLGDYREDDLALAVEKAKIFGRAVESYKSFLLGKPTLVFCVNLDHMAKVSAEFHAQGFKTARVSAVTSLEERDKIIEDLSSGATDLIISVGTMTTGVDIPCLQGLIMLRPTKSYNLFIQMVGRGTRPFPGKDHFKVIDHVNNLEEHGFAEDERPYAPDAKKSVKRNASVKTCPSCYAVVSVFAKICELCEHKFVEDQEASTLQIDPKYIVKEVTKEEIITRRVNQLISLIIKMGYSPGFAFYKLKETFGEDVAKRWSPEIKRIVLASPNYRPKHPPRPIQNE